MSFARGIGGRISGRRMLAPPPAAVFNGSFAAFAQALGLTVLQGFQPDLALTEGTTPLATTGNTSTTVVTVSGVRTGLPVPIWVKATNTLAIGAGAQFNIYYDGLGVTPSAQSPVTPAIGTPIALTGAGAGLSYAWAAGTSVTGDSWKTQIATLPDPVGGFPGTQATPASQPLISAGTNGRTAILANAQWLTDSLSPPAPGTTPFVFWMVLKLIATSAQSVLSGDGAGTGSYVYFDATPALSMFNGGTITGPTASTGVLSALQAAFTGSASDYAKWRNGAPVTGNAGNNASAGIRGLCARSNGANPANIELQAQLVISANGNNIQTQLAALTAAANTYFATTVG